MKAGFIGLGNLGYAMARRLISQGVELTVWNRTTRKTDDLAAAVGDTPAAVATDNDIIFLNLFDSGAVADILSGENGLLSVSCEGKTIIDTTTNHFNAVPYFYDLLRKAGGQYVESPILGSVVPASKGALTIVVSGEEDAYKKALPYLEKLGQHIFYLEKPTLATRMKLVNNLALGAIMAAIAESLAFGESAGIDRDKVLEILSVGGGNSGVLNAKKQKLLDRDYSPHFTVNAIYKDLHYLQDMAEEQKRPLFIGGIARELFGLARARGYENDDFSAVYKALEKNEVF